jgi:predicted dehydrogenase
VTGPAEPAEVAVGIIGFGRWGPKLARALAGEPGVRLAAVAVRSAASAREAGERTGVPVTTDATGLAAADDVDAIVVATPAPSHAPLACAALAAGKHVLVEKPLATSCADAVALAGLAERSGRVLAVGHVYLHHPAVAELAALQADGRLGRIRRISASWRNPDPSPSDQSVLWNLGPHPASIAVRLLGDDVAWVQAAAAPGRAAGDAVGVRFEYRSGAGVAIELDWQANGKARLAAIEGTAGVAEFTDGATAPLRLAAPPGAAPAAVQVGAEPPLTAEVRAFVRAVREGGPDPAGAREGVAVVRLLEAAARSAAAGVRVDPADLAPAQDPRAQPASSVS